MNSSLTRFPKVSIVINTYNRAHTLPRTLSSLKYLRYSGDFEVVVVNGPSTDNTDNILQEWRGQIKIGRCEETNLSKSRNIGIALASGEVIAFLDDDAIPEANWLNELIDTYLSDPNIGAAGGKVYNPTGVSFQAEYIYADRLGNSINLQKPVLDKSFPFSWRFPQNMGCNASYRKDYLLKVGGFDEEYEYYLDETDVCNRLTDAGYIVAQIDGAYVHHKFSSSHLRDQRSIIKNHFPIIKNKIYYSNIYATEYIPKSEIDADNEKFIDGFRQTIKERIKTKVLPKAELVRFESQVRDAKRVGIAQATEARKIGRKFISETTLKEFSSTFKKFITYTNNESLEIVFVDKYYCEPGGGTTYFKTLALELSKLGHIVHIICEGKNSFDTVDFENGVWVHRITTKNYDLSTEAIERCIPQHIWNWSYSALTEARRIELHRHIDVVEAPLWDTEGCSFMLEGSWPLVTFLITPLAVWLKCNPNQSSDPNFMKSFAKPMLSLEKEILMRSHNVKADSEGIVQNVEDLYSFKFDRNRLSVILLGIPCVSDLKISRNDNDIRILFVGRLEARKGVDVLLDCIPEILEMHSNVSFILAGDDSISSNGINYKLDFIEKNSNNKYVMDNVRFCGKVSDEELESLYKECDIFVSPSRYESFGLIFLEAMREGKPVIGCSTGGMVEVIENGFNGLLAKPSDKISLMKCLEILINDSDLRIKMGRNGYSRFLERFTSEMMASKTVDLYRTIIGRRHEDFVR